MNLAWIPNSFTMGNLLLGFFSIIFSSVGSTTGYITAAIMILGAALLDGCDGQIARMLKVSSKLGAELDSLADCVAFGVAPGFLFYHKYLRGLNVNINGYSVDAGIFIAAIFPICAAYRLARFNVSSTPNSFSGLPSPIAGIIIALFPIVFNNVNIPNWILTAIFVTIALLMVSTIKYSKPQSYIFKNLSLIKFIIFLILLVLVIFLFKKWTLVIIVALYLLSGFLSFIIQFVQDHKY